MSGVEIVILVIVGGAILGLAGIVMYYVMENVLGIKN